MATLYTTATAATTSPAVTLRSVGTSGGQAAAFTYDLARSVVYTRQGNPAWAGQERDNVLDTITRSNDLFFGGAVSDWVNLAKVDIPQADEQQRLLANLIEVVNRDTLPLPGSGTSRATTKPSSSPRVTITPTAELPGDSTPTSLPTRQVVRRRTGRASGSRRTSIRIRP